MASNADPGREGTGANTHDVAGHQDRVLVGGARGVGVVAEHPAVHLAFTGEADELHLALEQAWAAGQVDRLG
jgi:hypothetical protein